MSKQKPKLDPCAEDPSRALAVAAESLERAASEIETEPKKSLLGQLALEVRDVHGRYVWARALK
jgi:hypothetical protein